MFSLMDKVPSGIEPMLKDLEEHIMSAGLADMVASAETITSVSDYFVKILFPRLQGEDPHHIVCLFFVTGL